MIIASLSDNSFLGRQKGSKRTVYLLMRIPIFENLSLRELRFIEKLIYVRRYASGEPIFQQGDPSLGMYVVKTGAVKIIRQLPGGHPRRIATLTSGEFFGELGIIDDAPRSAAAVAHDATETIGFFKPDLMSLIHRRPDVGLKILLSVAATLSARLRHVHEELERHILNPPTEIQIRSRITVNF